MPRQVQATNVIKSVAKILCRGMTFLVLNNRVAILTKGLFSLCGNIEQ